MKLYINKHGKIFTEKQLEEKYLNYDSIKKYLMDGYFRSDFIEFFCNTLTATATKDILDSFIMCIKADVKGNLGMEEKEVDDEEIIKALKES